MKMLLVVLIVLINCNEFSCQLPQLTVNVGDIDLHIHAGGEMESHHGEEGHHGDQFFNNLFLIHNQLRTYRRRPEI